LPKYKHKMRNSLKIWRFHVILIYNTEKNIEPTTNLSSLLNYSPHLGNAMSLAAIYKQNVTSLHLTNQCHLRCTCNPVALYLTRLLLRY
jgi:hypothetical protein